MWLIFLEILNLEFFLKGFMKRQIAKKNRNKHIFSVCVLGSRCFFRINSATLDTYLTLYLKVKDSLNPRQYWSELTEHLCDRPYLLIGNAKKFGENITWSEFGCDKDKLPTKMKTKVDSAVLCFRISWLVLGQEGCLSILRNVS